MGLSVNVTSRFIVLRERRPRRSTQRSSSAASDGYKRQAGSLISGNEDGVKHASMGSLFALQHIGYTIPPEAATGWLGTIGPGKSYLDEGSGGPENDFTNLSTTTMAWNLMYLAKLLKDNHFFPQKGNSSTDWASGIKPGFDKIDKWF